MNGIILFGHGARDIRWREPFYQLASLWKKCTPEVPVELAFLEMMQPDLQSAVKKLVAMKVQKISIIPVFFGQGGHLRNDFPILIEQCRKEFIGIEFNVSTAVGEDMGVLNAIIDFAKRSMANS